MMNENNENLFTKVVKKKILLFLFGGGCGTTFLIFMVGFPVFIAILVVLGLFNDGNNGGSSVCHNYKSVDAICKQMVVNGQSVSVDEYVAGVITHEFNYAPEETMKAQAVAARSYGLNGATKDENGNCIISDTSQSFQTHEANYSDKAMQAAKDTSGIILVDENGNVARSEYSSNSLPKPYSSYANSSTVTMSERNLEIPKSWWENNKSCEVSRLNKVNENNGVSELDAYGRPVYGCGHGRGMGQIAAMYLDTEKGYNYEQILEFFYGKDSKYNWSLASTDGTVGSSNCGSSASSSSFVESYVSWMIDVANDDKHGYSQYTSDGGAGREFNPDVDCSSFVWYALVKGAGIDASDLGGSAFGTGGMEEPLTKNGFKKYTYKSASELQRGDILWNSGHTEVYVGDGKNVGAHWNWDGKVGDSGGSEVDVKAIDNDTAHSWTSYFRYEGNK